MQEVEFCRSLLGFDEIWHVKDVEFDKPSNRLDIMLSYGEAPKKRFFSLAKDGEEIETRKVRHLPILGMRTYLIIPADKSIDESHILFDEGSSYSHGLEAYVKQAIENCKSYQGVTTLTGLSASDVRELSQRLGVSIAIQQDNYEETDIEEQAREFEESAQLAKDFEIISNDNVPAETHDCWRKLLNGEVQLASQPVALQMLLQRLRQDIERNPGETTTLASMALVRKYFLKNHRQHKDDLLTLASGKSAPKSSANNIRMIEGGLPAEQHDCWQQLISGQLNLETGHVSLQMMLEKVRQSVQKKPTDSNRLAGARILRQFFAKHQRRLQPEIQQLGVEHLSNEQVSGKLIVPHENHACWQELLDGELTVPTSVVGLQMMIKQVRMSVQKNNSSENRFAGIKILRQYFIKHLSRHQKEIHYLANMGHAESALSQNDVNALPPETHESWQRLIEGDLVLETDAVALKMMLESIRISIENNPTEESRLAGAKILRQYFMKHKQKHQSEISKLVAA